MQALGLIEVIGYPAAIEAADAALKAANITLSGVSKVGSGIMTVQLFGDVGAITAAVEAGGSAAERIGKVRATHVIPRVDESLIGKVIQAGTAKADDEKKVLNTVPMSESEPAENNEAHTLTQQSDEVTADAAPTTLEVSNEEVISADDLSKKSNTELRELIQTLGINVSVKKLREAKKSELIKMITDAKQ